MKAATAGLPSKIFGGLGAAGSFFADPAMRFGIKFAVAGCLAFYGSQLLRLGEPIWSLLTVMVLMVAQYVGAIAEKSLFRFVGTVVGAVLGFLYTAGLEQNPVLFLLAVGSTVGVCIVLFGQPRAPYAFFLCGLSVLVISSNGMTNPENSWEYALARTEEVFLGVLATMIVTSLLWPRFARVEFRAKVHEECRELGREFRLLASTFLEEAPAAVQPSEARLRIAGLRTLLNFGSRESAFFRKRFPTYSEITSTLGRIASSLEILQDSPRFHPVYREKLDASLRGLVDLLASAFDALAAEDSPRAGELLKQAGKAFEEVNQLIHQLRQNKNLAKDVPAGAAMDLGGWVLSLQEIFHHLERLRELIGTIPDEMVDSKETLPKSNPPLDPFWIRNGIRSAIAVGLGLIVQNWLQPPGGAMVALSTFVFSALTRLYPGGEGDRRAFHYVVRTGALGLLYIPVMLVMTPMLSEYVIFNLILGAALFLFGFNFFRVPGMSFTMQVWLLTIVGTAGLNAQEPVNFQQIAGVYFGIIVGMLIAAVVQRLLWPVLPQWQLRDRIVEWITLCQELARRKPDKAWHFLRLALLPGEVRAWVQVMNKPDCPPGETDRLRAAAASLGKVAAYLKGTRGSWEDVLPEEFRPDIRKSLENLLAALAATLESPKNLLFENHPDNSPEENLEHALKNWMDIAAQTRRQMLADDYPCDFSMATLGYFDRAASAAAETLRAVKLFRELRVSHYMGDYVL